MSTAILISGNMRTFDKCLPTIHWHVLRHFPGASFYVSTVKDGDEYKAELLREKFPDARVTIEVKPWQPDFRLADNGVPPIPDGWQPGRAMYGHEPYAISVPPQAILGQLWQLQNAWDLYLRTRFDGEWHPRQRFVRVRPDLWFHSSNPAQFGVVEANMVKSPYWGRFGGINDRFAIMGHAAAASYFCTFSNVRNLIAAGCPFHPESLVKASVEATGGYVLDNLRTEFSTLRPNGEMRPPEIITADLAHAASTG